MLDTSSEGFPSVASTATDPAMSLTRSPVTSPKSRLVGATMVHCAISPGLTLRLASTPNDISHPSKFKTYRVPPGSPSRHPGIPPTITSEFRQPSPHGRANPHPRVPPHGHDPGSAQPSSQLRPTITSGFR